MSDLRTVNIFQSLLMSTSNGSIQASTTNTTAALDRFFSQFGVTETTVADNGAQLSSAEFKHLQQHG